MATWLYADFATKTGADRLTRLRQHIAEVEAAINIDVSADGKSRSSGTLESKLKRLYELLSEYEASASNRRGGGFTNIRYT